jgi:hypothetical protein
VRGSTDSLAAQEETRCLWCGDLSKGAPPEHIIPDALGCPEKAVLRDGEVCGPCNHKFGQILDLALVQSLDVLLWSLGHKGKDGRGLSISSRSNARTLVSQGSRELHINFGPGDVELRNGQKLKSPNQSANVLQGSFVVDGSLATSTFSARIFAHPHVARALHKVAIESIALFRGVPAASAVDLTLAREFARFGHGERRVVIKMPEQLPRVDAWKNTLFAPSITDFGEVIVQIILANFTVIVDLSPKQTFVARLRGLLEISPRMPTWWFEPPWK